MEKEYLYKTTCDVSGVVRNSAREFLETSNRCSARSGIINGRNSTWGAEWWAHAEDQVLRTTLFHAEAPGCQCGKLE